MRAAVAQADKTVAIQEKATPILRPNEILLKVKSLGLNPADWKHVSALSKPGDIAGCDFVGEVTEIGSAVPAGKVSKGEIRWGFTRGGLNPDRGGFAEFVAVEWDITGLVPSNITTEAAASIPIPFMTAVQALYLRLKLPEYPAKASGGWFLVWSGSTSVGQYAIQLAKLSGFKVATTASPSRWDTLKALGADVCVDYKDPEVTAKLKAATGDAISYGIDCIAEGGTIQQAQLAFRPEGGELCAILFDLSNLPRPEVKTQCTLVYTMLGQDQSWGPFNFSTSPEDRAKFVQWAALSTELFRDGKVKPMATELVGELNDIQKGLEVLQSGKHTTKLVVNVNSH